MPAQEATAANHLPTQLMVILREQPVIDQNSVSIAAATATADLPIAIGLD
jgi:hypothetical protein